MVKFFDALMTMIKGLLLGNGKFEEVSYFGIIEQFIYDGIISQFIKNPQ